MFEHMTEEEARQAILDDVAEYVRRYHAPKEFREGDRISYAGRVYDEREVVNLVDASLKFWLTAGEYAARFEKDFAEYLGVPYVLLVNSGSSANLLAFMTLTSPLLKDRRILPGDEVITVAAGFPTTVAPIIQYGAVPVFLDVTIPEYNVDVSCLEAALSPRTKAVMLAHTLGNPFDLASVRSFCDRHGLWLIEDNCDALGSEYEMDGKTYLTGTVGDIGTSSFYPPHHMTMGEGGAVYMKDPLLHRIALSMRDWGRDCRCPSGRDNICGHRFDRQYGELPAGYDHKYVYSHFGYNLKATDLQAAVGCAQLAKFPSFVAKRRHNFAFLFDCIVIYADEEVLSSIILPRANERSVPSWFGFLITLTKDGLRPSVVRKIEDAGVQTRMLFAGNLTRHPAFDAMRRDGSGYRIAQELVNTDVIMNNTFWVGVYPGMDDKKLEYMAKTIVRSIREAINDKDRD